MIGDFLRDCIKKSGFKQEEIAKKLGVTTPGLSKMLNKTDINTKILDKFSLILGYDVYLKYKGANSIPEERILPITVDRQNREIVRLVPTFAHANYLQGHSDPEYITTLPESEWETL